MTSNRISVFTVVVNARNQPLLYTFICMKSNPSNYIPSEYCLALCQVRTTSPIPNIATNSKTRSTKIYKIKLCMLRYIK